MKGQATIREKGVAAVVAMLLLCLAGPSLHAQGDPEYTMEIGGGIGLAGYLGDFNGNLTKELQPMGTAVLRKLFNPWAGLRFSLAASKLKGTSEGTDSYYPEFREGSVTTPREGLPYKFSSTVADASAVFEYNFWPYGTGRDYRGARRVVPYIYGGFGLTYASGEEKDVFTGNVPMGVGVKCKVAERLNLGVQWGVTFTLSDELDGVKDPLMVKSSGAFKNTDCYSALSVTLTYSFKERCRTCHNADEN